MSRIRTLFAAFAVAFAFVALTPGVAGANLNSVSLTVDCVAVNADGSYNAVFGYDNSGAQLDVPVGTTTVKGSTYTNEVLPAKYDGSQPTRFYSGSHRAVFTVQFAADESVTWKLAYDKNGGVGEVEVAATASANSPQCAAGPELPGAGNGSGQIIVIGFSALVAGIVSLLRRRRVA